MNQSGQPAETQAKINRKKWWAAVWDGLVVDPEARHYKQMHTAIWLYLYLLLHANRKTGWLKHRYQVIAAKMGVTERAVGYWFSRLRKHNYITTRQTGRGLEIQVQKWRSWGKLKKPDSKVSGEQPANGDQTDGPAQY